MTGAPASPPLRIDARAYALVALLALAASAPSLFNGFAYDDQWIIVVNGRVHALHRWVDWFQTSYWPISEKSLYRPLTSAGFALQWVVGHGEPWIFHAVNIALYAAGAVAFTWLASLLLPATAALIVGALFAVDPVHVEAVGNVVGQSELSAGLLMLIATAMYVRARHAGGPGREQRLVLGALYLVAVLLKEHAFVLPAWFLIAECTVLRSAGDVRGRVQKLLPLFVLFATIGAFALVARWDVLGRIGGDTPHPALDGLGALQRALAMLGIVPDLARLLVWPARLYADYSPAQVIISSTPDPSQVNGLLIICGAAAIVAVAWRRSAVAAFGLLIAGVVWLPTANLAFPSGVLLAERTLYLPSGGVLLAAGAAFEWLDRRVLSPPWTRQAAGAVLAIVLVLGTVHSIQRQRVWRSSEEVFWTMMRDEPLSFKAHHSWGAILFDRGDRVGGEREWRKTMRIFPTYHKVYQDLADRYVQGHLCAAAIPLYEKALDLGGSLPLSRAGLIVCQLQLAQFRAARHTARLGIIDGDDPKWFRARLFSAESALVANDSLRR